MNTERDLFIKGKEEGRLGLKRKWKTSNMNICIYIVINKIEERGQD